MSLWYAETEENMSPAEAGAGTLSSSPGVRTPYVTVRQVTTGAWSRQKGTASVRFLGKDTPTCPTSGPLVTPVDSVREHRKSPQRPRPHTPTCSYPF